MTTKDTVAHGLLGPDPPPELRHRNRRLFLLFGIGLAALLYAWGVGRQFVLPPEIRWGSRFTHEDRRQITEALDREYPGWRNGRLPPTRENFFEYLEEPFARLENKIVVEPVTNHPHNKGLERSGCQAYVRIYSAIGHRSPTGGLTRRFTLVPPDEASHPADKGTPHNDSPSQSDPAWDGDLSRWTKPWHTPCQPPGNHETSHTATVLHLTILVGNLRTQENLIQSITRPVCLERNTTPTHRERASGRPSRIRTIPTPTAGSPVA